MSYECSAMKILEGGQSCFARHAIREEEAQHECHNLIGSFTSPNRIVAGQKCNPAMVNQRIMPQTKLYLRFPRSDQPAEFLMPSFFFTVAKTGSASGDRLSKNTAGINHTKNTRLLITIHKKPWWFANRKGQRKYPAKPTTRVRRVFAVNGCMLNFFHKKI